MNKINERKHWSGPNGEGPGWICDHCGQPITTAEEGWLEWVSGYTDNGERFARDVRIVHHLLASPFRQTAEDGCYLSQMEELAKDRGTLSHGHLHSYLGTEGLIELLSCVATEHGAERDFLSVIQRLHIPGYEQARPFFRQAIENGVIEPNMEEGFYRPQELATIINLYAKPKGGQ